MIVTDDDLDEYAQKLVPRLNRIGEPDNPDIPVMAHRLHQIRSSVDRMADEYAAIQGWLQLRHEI
jgi:hypothetical protein